MAFACCIIEKESKQTIGSICMILPLNQGMKELSFRWPNDEKKNEMALIGRETFDSFLRSTMRIIVVASTHFIGYYFNCDPKKNWPLLEMFGWFFNWTLKPIQQCETVVKNSSLAFTWLNPKANFPFHSLISTSLSLTHALFPHTIDNF